MLAPLASRRIGNVCVGNRLDGESLRIGSKNIASMIYLNRLEI